MTIRDLASGLGVSPATVMNLKREGMPGDLAGARAWYAQRGDRRKVKGPTAAERGTGDLVDLSDEGLSGTIVRLKQVERAIAKSIVQAHKDGRIADGINLRREHVAAIKAIYEAEAKSIKINEARGRLISVDRALNLINDAMQSAILVLRRLPELGRTPEERARLEAFLNGVLAEIRTGAATGLNKAA